ncbi:MAG: hypothetical protein LBO72_05115 [Helicobacteraceae bacterium]|jgi:hypothetical protein|nr:hypothetical protein [Helicobacteraceae bacterium]
MLLLDFSSLFIQAAFSLRKRGLLYSKDHLRSTFLSRLFVVCKRFRKYGKLHIFADSGKYWRVELFAGYKKKRAERRLSDDVDWDKLHSLQDSIIDEMRANLPYAIVSVDAMEADDLIALACRFYAPKNKRHLIISSDKDLTQLLRSPNISQWSAGKRSFLQFDPKAFKAQLLRGDSSDSVPSIYADEDYLIGSFGRRRLTDARLKDVDITSVETFRAYYKDDSEIERITANYIRNRTLIDLRCVPRKFFPLFHAALKAARQTAEQSAPNAESYLAKYNLLSKFKAIDAPKAPPSNAQNANRVNTDRSLSADRAKNKRPSPKRFTDRATDKQSSFAQPADRVKPQLSRKTFPKPNAPKNQPNPRSTTANNRKEYDE